MGAVTMGKHSVPNDLDARDLSHVLMLPELVELVELETY
jgi:hypothetical protein